MYGPLFNLHEKIREHGSVATLAVMIDRTQQTWSPSSQNIYPIRTPQTGIPEQKPNFKNYKKILEKSSIFP